MVVLASTGAIQACALAGCASSPTASIVVPSYGVGAQACAAANDLRDDDRDGLADACEDSAAERFAPIVYHASDEPNLPVDVDALLASSSLYFYDDACAPDLHIPVVHAPTQGDLIAHAFDGGCGAADVVHSAGTRSTKKKRTFYLEDVSLGARKGSSDPRAWTTYAHVYASANGGVTIQYWRLYAFNDGASQHGGDWEGLHVVLDARLEPVFVRLLGHTTIEEIPWQEMEVESGHVRVWSEPGGHATSAHGSLGGVFRHETWSTGQATLPDGSKRKAARLINIGEKTAPRSGQLFVAYSGLWGSPGTLYATSGYWGPAFNETKMDGTFVTAWCGGMTGSQRADECTPAAVTR